MRMMILTAVVVLLGVQPAWAKDKKPVGILAASVGSDVVLADPGGGWTSSIETGPVAWLFPAPGGILFAPDLVHGRTTVVDLRRRVVGDRLDGVTMPHFGSLSDRYVVVAGNVLIVSYPERALLDRFAAGIENPWQVEVLADNTVMIVLERKPHEDGGSILTAMNLRGGEIVYRRPLPGDVRHFAFSSAFGVMALADAGSNEVHLVDPATLAPVARLEPPGSPVDVAFGGGGTTVVVATELRDGGGELVGWKLKAGKSGLEEKKKWRVPLAGSPVRMASSPDGRYVAVGLTTGQIQVIEVEKQRDVAMVELSSAPRDLVWCDPGLAGPLVPEWSDGKPPVLGGISRD